MPRAPRKDQKRNILHKRLGMQSINWGSNLEIQIVEYVYSFYMRNKHLGKPVMLAYHGQNLIKLKLLNEILHHLRKLRPVYHLYFLTIDQGIEWGV